MDIVFLIGRIIFGGFFIYNGLNHLILQREGVTQYASYKGVPAPELSVVVTGLMILAGGLSVLVGYQVIIGAWLLVVFLVPTAIIMHNFWMESDPMAKANQMVHFSKNIALAGAALIISTIPSWPISLGG